MGSCPCRPAMAPWPRTPWPSIFARCGGAACGATRRGCWDLPKLGSSEFELWRRRLDHAKRMWMHNGWLGDQSPSTMRALVDFYRGEHWKMTEGPGIFSSLDETELVTVNKIFSVWN